MVGSGELDCMEFRPSPRSLEVQSALLQQLQEMNFYHKNMQLTDRHHNHSWWNLHSILPSKSGMNTHIFQEEAQI